ncbi:MAG: N-acetyltransferase [Armatimonadetes bacterium]|nr:N-acetyltransferase [Armatimonadota bacterium]
MSLHVRKARLSDAPVIQALIEPFARQDEMLHRGLGEICENIRDFVVAEADNEILGCCSLHVDTPELAEIKALAVAAGAQKRGVGAALVRACVEEARELGLQTVYALTYRPGFFEKQGFQLTEKSTLPHKVWNECVRCNKFPVCGEDAMTLQLVPAGFTGNTPMVQEVENAAKDPMKV